MNVTVSPRSEKPIYQQLYEQISAQILRGELASEFPLPPIRTMAKELRISVITVKKAWEMLEREGFIYSIVGRGCFVEDLSAAARTDKRIEKLTERLTKDLAYYREMGLTLHEIIRWVKHVYNEREN